MGKKNETLIIGRVKEAIRRIEHERDLETPLTLLGDALKKLNHENMIPENLDPFKLDEAIKLNREIQVRSSDLESEFDHLRQKFQKLRKKK